MEHAVHRLIIIYDTFILTGFNKLIGCGNVHRMQLDNKPEEDNARFR